MARAALLLLLGANLLAASGCGWDATGVGGTTAGESSLEVPAPGWRSHLRSWQRELRAAAEANPTATYPTPSAADLLSRLRDTSTRYGFRVVSVRILHAPQGAPRVIVETARPAQFVRSVPAIMRTLDPHRPSAEDWLGWSYEGFFFGAQDRDGRPFLAVFNTMRLHSGGQWARAERFFPYPHG
jgi:hypothetical protein